MKKTYKVNYVPIHPIIGRGDPTPRKEKRDSLVFNHHVNHMLKWLTAAYGLDPVLLQACVGYVSFIEHLFEHKGWKSAIKINKLLRLRVTRWLALQEIEDSVLSLTYDGLPTKLGDLIPLIRRKDPQILRGILTILNVTRRVTPKVLDPDISTIISPYTGKEIDLSDDISKFVCKLKKFSRKSKSRKFRGLFKNGVAQVQDFRGFHLSTKTGPTGIQALVSSLAELELINQPNYEGLLNSIYTLGGPELERKMKVCYLNVSLLQETLNWPKLSDIRDDKHSIRKISAIPDAEGKTRVVAIGDYWSQTCLYPIHKWIYLCLEMIPQDKTFKQGDDLRRIPFDGETTYYCFDLSAATDRFPIKIITGLLKELVGSEKALAWYDIMVGQPFDYKDPEGNRHELKYSVGNPMGFLSSWGSFALSHHLILFICCLRVSQDFKSSKYMLLGDDIIIWDERLATEYLKLIKDIGVGISEVKTHISKCFFEFAKRYFYNGVEISPCSAKGFIEQRKAITSFIEFNYQLQDRGWIPVESIQHSVIQYYSLSHWWKAKARQKLFQRVVQSQCLYKVMRGTGSDLEYINSILVTFHPFHGPLSCTQDSLAKAWLESAVVQTFVDSAEKFTGDLEDRLFNLCIKVTGDPEIDDDVITSNPASYVVGKFVEEAYIRSMNRAYTIDTELKGTWSPKFKVLIGANCEQILSKRNYALVSSASSILAKKVKETLHPLVIDGIYGW